MTCGYRVNVIVDINAVPIGTGGAGIVPREGNVAGVGPSQYPGTFGNTQTMRLIQSEIVPGTFGAPTAANIGTAISSAATDIQAQITAAVIAQIVAWGTGSE